MLLRKYINSPDMHSCNIVSTICRRKKSRDPVPTSGSKQPPAQSFYVRHDNHNKEYRRREMDVGRPRKAVYIGEHGMRFEHTKSRSLFIKQENLKDSIQNIKHAFTSDRGKPIKCLGKLFNESMCDTKSITKIAREGNGSIQWTNAGLQL